ncbi:MAG: hypothetical protein VYD64_03060, partial [Pseudomonadota bacterium]|nr:hypothetical protein [Pseudomonadota bacterium]
ADEAERPKTEFKPATRIYVVPTTGETLPPVVRNHLPPAGVDPVMSGSTRTVPPGVDPIITGDNAGTAGTSRPQGGEARRAPYPVSTSMLLN